MILPEAISINNNLEFFQYLNDIPSKNLAIVKKLEIKMDENYSY